VQCLALALSLSLQTSNQPLNRSFPLALARSLLLLVQQVVRCYKSRGTVASSSARVPMNMERVRCFFFLCRGREGSAVSNGVASSLVEMARCLPITAVVAAGDVATGGALALVVMMGVMSMVGSEVGSEEVVVVVLGVVLAVELVGTCCAEEDRKPRWEAAITGPLPDSDALLLVGSENESGDALPGGIDWQSRRDA